MDTRWLPLKQFKPNISRVTLMQAVIHSNKAVKTYSIFLFSNVAVTILASVLVLFCLIAIGNYNFTLSSSWALLHHAVGGMIDIIRSTMSMITLFKTSESTQLLLLLSMPAWCNQDLRIVIFYIAITTLYFTLWTLGIVCIYIMVQISIHHQHCHNIIY